MVVKDVEFFDIPKEIREFYNSVFELYEIRQRVGEYKSIEFIIHTRDHNPPHVHAKYDKKYEVVISLIDFKILAGNIPDKNKNIAIKWVKKNKDNLLNKWNDLTITSTLPLTKSMLDSKEPVEI